MEITNYLPILYITLLIIISGMFSGSETSVTSVNKSKIHKLANKGDKKAKRLRKEILFKLVNLDLCFILYLFVLLCV